MQSCKSLVLKCVPRKSTSSSSSSSVEERFELEDAGGEKKKSIYPFDCDGEEMIVWTDAEIHLGSRVLCRLDYFWTNKLIHVLYHWDRFHSRYQYDCCGFVMLMNGMPESIVNEFSQDDNDNRPRLQEYMWMKPWVSGEALHSMDTLAFLTEKDFCVHFALYLGDSYCLSKIGIDGELEVESISTLCKMYNSTKFCLVFPILTTNFAHNSACGDGDLSGMQMPGKN